MRPSNSIINKLSQSYQSATQTVPLCCICNSDTYKELFRLDRHDLGLPISQCQQCGHITLRPRPSADWFDTFYQDFYWPLYIGHRFKDLDDMFVSDCCEQRANEIFEGIRPYFPNTIDSLLDIGAGQGGLLATAKRELPSTICLGIEPSTTGVDYCHSRHGIEVIHGEWNSLSAKQIPPNISVITSVHVIEHLNDPASALRLAAQKLCPETGVIYVEVPNILSDAWHGKDFFHIAHTHYFYPQTLERLCIASGLEPFARTEGLARIWPWACGVLCRKAPVHTTANNQQPSSKELASVAFAVSSRAGFSSQRWLFSHFVRAARRLGIINPLPKRA